MRLFVLNTRCFRPSDGVEERVHRPLREHQVVGAQVAVLRERIRFLRLGLAAQRAECTDKSIWSCIFQFSGHERHEHDRLALFKSLRLGIFLRKVPRVEPGPMRMNEDTEEWERRRVLECPQPLNYSTPDTDASSFGKYRRHWVRSLPPIFLMHDGRVVIDEVCVRREVWLSVIHSIRTGTTFLPTIYLTGDRARAAHENPPLTLRTFKCCAECWECAAARDRKLTREVIHIHDTDESGSDNEERNAEYGDLNPLWWRYTLTPRGRVKDFEDVLIPHTVDTRQLIWHNNQYPFLPSTLVGPYTHRGISLDAIRNFLEPNKKQKKNTRFVGAQDMEGYRYLITDWKSLYISQWWSRGTPQLLTGKATAMSWVTSGHGKKEGPPVLYTLAHTPITKKPIFRCEHFVEDNLPAEFRRLDLRGGFGEMETQLTVHGIPAAQL